MPTPISETKAEYARRMADDGGGGLASQAQVEANIEASFSDVANVLTDPGDVPASASVRPAGRFGTADDLKEYLELGGLVASDGVNTVPMGFVYVLQEYDEIYEQDMYIVYIDEDS